MWISQLSSTTIKFHYPDKQTKQSKAEDRNALVAQCNSTWNDANGWRKENKKTDKWRWTLRLQNIERSFVSFLYHVTGVGEGQNMLQCDVMLILVLNKITILQRSKVNQNALLLWVIISLIEEKLN